MTFQEKPMTARLEWLTQFGDERLPPRFWAKVRVSENGCWLWAGSLNHGGYGQFYWQGRLLASHRVSVAVLVGPFDEALQIDHLCKVPECVNPAHLEPVTPQTNIARSESKATLHKNQTHCHKGHAFSPENTRIVRRKNRNWTRVCRECAKATAKACYRARVQAIRGAQTWEPVD